MTASVGLLQCRNCFTSFHANPYGHVADGLVKLILAQKHDFYFRIDTHGKFKCKDRSFSEIKMCIRQLKSSCIWQSIIKIHSLDSDLIDIYIHVQ